MAEPKFAEGRADLSPADPVRAGSSGCWTLTLTVGEEGVPPGAIIRISVPHGFTPPQTDNPDAPGYVCVESGNPAAALELAVAAASEEGFDAFTGQDSTAGVFLFVQRAPLKPDDTIRLIYGAGPGRAYASPFAGAAPFPVYLCTDGRAYPERFFPLQEPPTLEVTNTDLHRLEVTASPGDGADISLDLRVVARDVRGNRCMGWNGWFRVEPVEPIGGEARIPAPQKREDPTGEGILFQIGLPEARQGPVRFRVLESETGLQGMSNPMSPGERTPFWGDLHACASEGVRSRSALDFELTVGPTPTAKKTSFTFHTEVLPEGLSPSTAGTGLLRFSLPDAQSEEMAASHLLEIYSCWGNREHWGARRPDIRLDRHPDRTVHAVLSQGVIAGFAAGSNSRFGTAGDACRADAGCGYPGGLTAVYAASLTREALFTALRERRCYATTGPRILLHAEINGHEMGRVVEVRSEDIPARRERHISVDVNGTAPVDRIEVVRNNIEVCTYRGDGEDVAFEWDDRQDLSRIALPRPLQGGALSCYYFVRVTQTDGEVAWSSPIWFVLRPE